MIQVSLRCHGLRFNAVNFLSTNFGYYDRQRIIDETLCHF